jgi:outer membrane protein
MEARKPHVVLLVLVAVLVAAGSAFGQAQNPPENPSPSVPERKLPVNLYQYSKGRLWFPISIKPYTERPVPPPELTNTPRVDQMLREGKLTLSLQDAISLALENNLGISVQRYTTWIAGTDLLRAEAGQSLRGATGFTPVLGVIPTPSFDPVLSSTLSWTRSSFPVNNPFTSGVGLTRQVSLVNYSAQANFQYSQGFHTGTSFALAIDNTRASTTSPAVFLNPSVESQFVVSFQQQLLNGFGLLPNTRFIIEAKNNVQAASYAFQQQVMTTISQVEDLYWELVFTRENVKVQQAALATSQQLYEDNKRQVQIGTLAPIEVVRAESEVASDRQALIVAETTRLQQQTQLLNAITKNPMAPGLLNAEIVPTDTANVPPKIQVIPLQEAVREAWQNRPDLHQSELSLKNAGIEVRATRNALLPTLSLFGQYAGTGLGGNALVVNETPSSFQAVSTSPVVDANGNQLQVNGQPAFMGTPQAFTVLSRTLLTGGLPDALNSAFNGNFPTYAAGLTLNIPLRNRSAQADSARALLQQRQAETSYRQLQNTIVVDVRNAQIALEQDQARVQAAEKARILAQETLDAERKKFSLGVSTTFLVIQAQRDLTTAEGNELRAKVDLQEAQVAYEQAIGRTLQANRITVSDARNGRIYRSPLIPGSSDTFAADGEGATLAPAERPALR